jgi:multimeric flavodoxin WrbA
MVIVGLDYGYGGQMTLDEISGGAPYGASTISGADGRRQASHNELKGRRSSRPACGSFRLKDSWRNPSARKFP